MTSPSDGDALGPEQVAQYLAASVDPAYFCHQFGVIDDAQDDGSSTDGEILGTTPFRLWPAQFGLMIKLVSTKQLIILKARQLGISWLVCVYVLWLCLFRAGRTVLLFSKGQPEADELIRRIKALYDRLPDWLRETLPPKIEPDNTRQVGWENGSWIRSMPATKSAGVSYTASLIVLDEAAHMMHGQQLYLNAKPTIDGGGQIIILSTANGIGGMFHRLWQKAVAGTSSFLAVFLPWWARPERDKRWYRQIVADSDDPATVPQNYPANALEAFLVSGRLRFPTAWVDRQIPTVRAPLPRTAWPASLINPERVTSTVQHMPGLRAYAPSVPGRRYVVAADVAEGKEDGDYDAAVVLDEQTWEEVASLHGHWEPDEYADMLAALGDAYNHAPVIVERNNHGHAVLTTLKLKRYSNVACGPDGEPGWLTNLKTKPESIDLLASCLRDVLVTIHTETIVGELRVYRVLKGGKTGAEKGSHDDFVMALAIALAYIRLLRSGDRSGPVVGGAVREPSKTARLTEPPDPIRPRIPEPEGVWRP